MRGSWVSPSSGSRYSQWGGMGIKGCTLQVEVKGPLPTSKVLNKRELGGKLCENNQETGNYGKTITSGQLFPDRNADLNTKLISFSQKKHLKNSFQVSEK